MNRIKEVMKSKGIEDLRPTNTLLEKMGITFRIWMKWVDNKKDPELAQLPYIADFLNCEVSDLLSTEKKAKNEAESI